MEFCMVGHWIGTLRGEEDADEMKWENECLTFRNLGIHLFREYEVSLLISLFKISHNRFGADEYELFGNNLPKNFKKLPMVVYYLKYSLVMKTGNK